MLLGRRIGAEHCVEEFSCDLLENFGGHNLRIELRLESQGSEHSKGRMDSFRSADASLSIRGWPQKSACFLYKRAFSLFTYLLVCILWQSDVLARKKMLLFSASTESRDQILLKDCVQWGEGFQVHYQVHHLMVSVTWSAIQY